jgi:hypothetical protein
MQLRENYMSMNFFSRNFLSCVVGRVRWKKEACKVPISKVATVSDEAFALLLLENVWEAVKKRALTPTNTSCLPCSMSTASSVSTDDNGEDGNENAVAEESANTYSSKQRKKLLDKLAGTIEDRREPVLGKYTQQKYQRAGKFGGWSVEGLLRFQELMKTVRNDRALRGAEFDKRFLYEQEKMRWIFSKDTEDKSKNDSERHIINMLSIDDFFVDNEGEQVTQVSPV